MFNEQELKKKYIKKFIDGQINAIISNKKSTVEDYNEIERKARILFEREKINSNEQNLFYQKIEIAKKRKEKKASEKLSLQKINLGKRTKDLAFALTFATSIVVGIEFVKNVKVNETQIKTFTVQEVEDKNLSFYTEITEYDKIVQSTIKENNMLDQKEIKKYPITINNYNENKSLENDLNDSNINNITKNKLDNQPEYKLLEKVRDEYIDKNNKEDIINQCTKDELIINNADIEENTSSNIQNEKDTVSSNIQNEKDTVSSNIQNEKDTVSSNFQNDNIDDIDNLIHDISKEEIVKTENNIETTDVDDSTIDNSQVDGMSNDYITEGRLYDVSEADKLKLMALVAGEDSNSYEGSLAVITTILNRLEDESWSSYGNEPLEQATASGQFSAWNNSITQDCLNNPNNIPECTIQAVNDALAGKRNHNYVSFRSNQSNKGEQIGNNGNKYRETINPVK